MASETISLGTLKNGGSTHVRSTFAHDDDDNNFPQDGSLVEAKYMGTMADQREMTALGRVQALRVRMPWSQLTPPPRVNDHV